MNRRRVSEDGVKHSALDFTVSKFFVPDKRNAPNHQTESWRRIIKRERLIADDFHDKITELRRFFPPSEAWKVRQAAENHGQYASSLQHSSLLLPLLITGQSTACT